MRVTHADNVGYDMQSHRMNARLFAAAAAAGAAAGAELFTHFVAMNDSAMGPFVGSSERAAAADADADADGAADDSPDAAPWHRLFAARLTRLRSHPPTMFVATIQHFSYFLFFDPPGWNTFAAELERRQGLTLVHFSAQPNPVWSHLSVPPCLLDRGQIMQPTYPRKCAYVEPKSGRV